MQQAPLTGQQLALFIAVHVVCSASSVITETAFFQKLKNIISLV